MTATRVVVMKLGESALARLSGGRRFFYPSPDYMQADQQGRWTGKFVDGVWRATMQTNGMP